MNVDAWTLRYPNFEPEELCSPQTLAQYWHMIDPHWFDLFQKFRRHLGARLVVNVGEHRLRGTRTVAENQTIPGFAPQSMHILCRACDCHSPDMSLDDLYNQAKHFGKFYGIGRYKTWVHLDNRIIRTEWDKR